MTLIQKRNTVVSPPLRKQRNQPRNPSEYLLLCLLLYTNICVWVCFKFQKESISINEEFSLQEEIKQIRTLYFIQFYVLPFLVVKS